MASAELAGSIIGSNETDIRNGGKIITLTVLSDSWVPLGAPFDAQRQNIINGLTSASSQIQGWNNEVRDNILALPVTAVVRSNNSLVTITLGASVDYDIATAETITATVPATALVTSIVDLVATPTFTITRIREFSIIGNLIIGAPIVEAD